MKSSAAAAVPLLCGLVSACEPTPQQRVERLAPLVVHEIRAGPGGDVSGLLEQRQPLGKVEVYVDRSLTIAPYDRSPESPFGKLVGVFDDFIRSEVAFFGFGSPTREVPEQRVDRLAVHSLYDSATYGYANNDYADLFRIFQRDTLTTRIVITDGVQSDPEDLARLSAVADELHRWVTNGGAFAALLYRNAFHGQYYSDLSGEDPVYACDDRPLVVFVLAPSSRAIDDLLARLGDELRPAHLLRINGNDVGIRPMGETVPDTSKKERRGLRVARDIDETLVRGFRPIPYAVVVGRTGQDTDGYVPLQFEVVLSLRDHPWASLGREATERFVRQLHTEFHGWAFDERRLGDEPDSRAERDSTQPVPLLEAVQIDDRPAAPPGVAVQGDSLRARFTVPVRRPKSPRHDFVFLVTLRPSERGALDLIPESYSTDDDRSPTTCGRILKLRRLLGSIMLRNYIPGRTLLVADWR